MHLNILVKSVFTKNGNVKMFRISLALICLLFVKFGFVGGEVVFTKEPEKIITLISGSSIPDLVWKHNGSEENIIMNISMYNTYTKKLDKLAQKIYNNSWKVNAELEGLMIIKDQATLMFLLPWSGSFNAIIKMTLTSFQGRRDSSVNLTIQGVGFTREPSRTITVTVGSWIPNMVWTYNESSHDKVFAVISFSPSRNTSQMKVIGKKSRATLPWDRMSSQVNITNQATLVFTNTAAKYYEGIYTVKLEGSFVIHQVQRSNVSLIIQERKARNKNITPVVIAVPCAVLLLVAWAFVLRCVKRKWIRRKIVNTRYDNFDNSDELRWDAFISYSSKDFLWVKDLYETLEKPPFDLNVCIHQRDWELGRAVIDNMVDSVYCSGKTLVIMSKNYLESSYCMQELQIAMHKEIGSRLNSRKPTIVLIVIDDVSLKKLPKSLRQKSFLDFSNSEHRKHVKTQLLKVLGQRECNRVADEVYEMGSSSRNESRDVVDFVTLPP